MKYQKLIASFSQVRNNAIGSIETLSNVSLTGGKKNPMQGRITKETKGGSVMFFGNSKSNGYANMKNRNLIKSGDASEVKVFEPGKRPWGERIQNTPMITHKGMVYVELIYLHAPKTSYFLDGVPIAKTDIEGLKPSKKTGGDDVILRTMKLDTITKLKMGKLSV